MSRPDANSPLTYDDALRSAREIAQDPGTLVHYPHQGLESARYGRGFAFFQTLQTQTGETDGYVLVTTTAHASGVLSMSGRTIDSVIAEHLAKAEHDNRDIPDSELSIAHHLALAAHEAGCVSVDEMPGRAAIDSETADYAEFILIYLHGKGYAGLPGRKILARNDFLLQAPTPGRRYTQPCPHCGRPTIYQESYPRAVCGRCVSRATDRAGRRVTGFNTSLSGGMIAYYSDTVERTDGAAYEECVEVSRTGVCFIDGRRASMHESRFGGIIVQLTADDQLRPPLPPAQDGTRESRAERWFRRMIDRRSAR
ncbi:hypothetical protein GV791_30225 [Nocardia cyriacigeorgica]|uniref:Uncharacterized protein n=1 Tax=Nocardia cyriacigeorgica TaxID=135487 RepID=A0A6P1CWH0_9NOCA|nr:hypothetical protein [Nocardia cyriacigeorgica]MBF6081920.1 hypothetical protein [Nocardia cyriacigeorgica]MBF6427882.1 hypothetical protein [Nocardia cyriacigeorgica]NEW36801.1 hypothetical protein [Nocardia cyriacigeorgica]